jgi:hypothetical protein
VIYWLLPLTILIISILLVLGKSRGPISNDHLCFICEKRLSTKEAQFIADRSFCEKHFKTFEKKSWISVYLLECSPARPQEGVDLYEFKVDLINRGIDCFLTTDYAQVDDYILTTMELFVEEEKKEEVQRLLPRIN